MEVAGIYKKFKADSPLAVRMEEIAATPPPRAKPMPKTGTLPEYFMSIKCNNTLFLPCTPQLK